jgi:hypothetical protein
MIAFYWLDKETGECTVKGVCNEYTIALVHSTIKNPEPDSRYIKYFGERDEHTHILLLPKHIQERVSVLQIAPFNEYIEGIGIKLETVAEVCYICEEE